MFVVTLRSAAKGGGGGGHRRLGGFFVFFSLGKRRWNGKEKILDARAAIFFVLINHRLLPEEVNDVVDLRDQRLTEQWDLIDHLKP